MQAYFITFLLTVYLINYANWNEITPQEQDAIFIRARVLRNLHLMDALMSSASFDFMSRLALIQTGKDCYDAIERREKAAVSHRVR